MATKNNVNNRVYALRLSPNQDLKQEIVAFVRSFTVSDFGCLFFGLRQQKAFQYLGV